MPSGGAFPTASGAFSLFKYDKTIPTSIRLPIARQALRNPATKAWATSVPPSLVMAARLGSKPLAAMVATTMVVITAMLMTWAEFLKMELLLGDELSC